MTDRVLIERQGLVPMGVTNVLHVMCESVAPPPGANRAGTLPVVVDSQTGDTFYNWAHYGDTRKPAFVQSGDRNGG